MTEKIEKKVFVSEIIACELVSLNCYPVLKGILLRTGYFSSGANVLTRNPKIWHVNKRDFFELHLLGSDR